MRQFFGNFFGRVFEEFWTSFGHCFEWLFWIIHGTIYGHLVNASQMTYQMKILLLFGQFLSFLSLLGLSDCFWDNFWGWFLERSLWLFWELIKHMKSGAQFNRPNKHTEGPATRVNKQNLNLRFRIPENLFNDLGISN